MKRTGLCCKQRWGFSLSVAQVISSPSVTDRGWILDYRSINISSGHQFHFHRNTWLFQIPAVFIHNRDRGTSFFFTCSAVSARNKLCLLCSVNLPVTHVLVFKAIPSSVTRTKSFRLNGKICRIFQIFSWNVCIILESMWRFVFVS